MIYAGGIEGSGTGDTGQEKGTGAGVLTTHVVPQCHSATLWRAGVAVQEGEKEEVERWGRREGTMTFKFRGSGAGSHAAPAGNVTPSDVSGQAKYNLASTWKDVL